MEKCRHMKNTYELIAPCHFGLESVLKREIYDLGYDISKVEDGKVTFIGDADAIARANIFLRTAERVLLKVGEFKATTFTELFDNTKELEWEEFIPKNGKFWVTKANSINSKLFSSSDIQSIVKKAIVERLKGKYAVNWFEEDGNSYPIRVSLMKDVVTISLDTSGDSLHKRGYRPAAGKAPISETLAAALIMLTPWKSTLNLQLIVTINVGNHSISSSFLQDRYSNQRFIACLRHDITFNPIRLG